MLRLEVYIVMLWTATTNVDSGGVESSLKTSQVPREKSANLVAPAIYTAAVEIFVLSSGTLILSHMEGDRDKEENRGIRSGRRDCPSSNEANIALMLVPFQRV